MQRIRALDIARGFTVLFIAPVHTILMFSKPEVYSTWPCQVLRFIAEGPGAQLFMLLMGISFILSSKRDFATVLKRATLLLIAGYGLNFLKFVLPAQLGILPGGVYAELQIHPGFSGLFQVLLTGDILQFAAIAYFILYGVSRLPYYPSWATFITLTICFLSPLFYDLHSATPVINYFFQLLGGHTPIVFFPLLPWLVYPLAGLVIGHFLKVGNPLTFGYCLMTGFILMLISCSSWLPYYNKADGSFYRTYAPGTLYHLGIVLIWLYLAHWTAERNPSQLVTKGLTFLSRHITLIYFVQWLLICWSLPLIGFRSLGFNGSMFAATGYGMGVILVAGLLLLLKKDKQ